MGITICYCQLNIVITLCNQKGLHMKFKLIDQYTVRCVLTEDDMIENDIRLEDFFSDREKVHDFLDVIMNRAKDEIGYELNDEILSMQIMPLPKKGLAITISGKSDKDLNNFLDNVRSAANLIDEEDIDVQDELEVEDEAEELDHLLLSEQISESNIDIVHKKKNTTQNKGIEKKKDGIIVLRFTTFKDLEEFCFITQRPKYITSHLYKDTTQKSYYLIIEQGRLALKTFQFICQTASEFADIISKDATHTGFMKEHCELLITKKAISVIRGIAAIR